MGTIEHINSNLHAHLAIKHIKRNINDEFIYDEEQRIDTLWKSVQQGGSAYLENIFDYNGITISPRKQAFLNASFFLQMININSSNQRDFMNLIGEKIRKDVNNEIRLLLLIANELYRKDRVSSYRNFCKNIYKK